MQVGVRRKKEMDPRLLTIVAFLRDIAVILFVIVYCIDTL